jgi:hypothetical protein
MVYPSDDVAAAPEAAKVLLYVASSLHRTGETQIERV